LPRQPFGLSRNDNRGCGLDYPELNAVFPKEKGDPLKQVAF
jgi:hypothetical protein